MKKRFAALPCHWEEGMWSIGPLTHFLTFTFKSLMIIRQLSVFSILLLRQICCLLTDFGLPFPSLWCFGVCPLTHHQGIWRSRISRIFQYSCSEGISFDITRNIKMSSQGWREFPCMTPWAQPAPAWSAAHMGRFRGGDWHEELEGGHWSSQNPPLPFSVLQRFGQTTRSPCVWDSPFWEWQK